MTTPSTKLRERWLEALLPIVAQSGWTMVNAKQAARDADLTPGEQALAAPNGVTDLIDHFFDRAIDQMLEALATRDLTALRTHERVAAGVRAWLDALAGDKPAVRKAAALFQCSGCFDLRSAISTMNPLVRFDQQVFGR